jgi:hypothetical protein
MLSSVSTSGVIECIFVCVVWLAVSGGAHNVFQVVEYECSMHLCVGDI